MDASTYYQQIKAIDIAKVARDLLGERITEQNSQRLHVDCPHHASESQRSLHIDLSKGLWNCFGCQVGGDVIQLVEFVQTGQITKGITGSMTDSHRAARDYLGGTLGLPPLGRAGLTPEEIARMEERHAAAEKVFAALTTLTDIYHHALLDSPEVMEFIAKKWGFDEKVVRDFRVGWANSPDILAHLKARGIDERTALHTGAFIVDSQDHTLPFFKGRIFFPYFSKGRVVYAIGRRTKWTDKKDIAKYRKLQVYHPDLKKYVSPVIDNSVLFGEDILDAHPKELTVTEGITDAIATQANGFACISPVTVGFKKDDIERLLKRMRGVVRVFMVQDNEFSGIGMKGALAGARLLGDGGVEARIGIIPVPVDQSKARRELEELMGPDLSAKIRNADPSKRAKLLDLELDPSDKEYARELREKSKVDLCEWWMAGGTPAEYQKILDEAGSVLEVAIREAPRIDDGSNQQKVEAVSSILTEIGLAPPSLRDDLLRKLKDVIGVALSILRPEAAARARKQKQREKEEQKKTATSQASVVAMLDGGDAGSLKEVLLKMVQAAQAQGNRISYEKLGVEAYHWFLSAGGVFFYVDEETPCLFFESRVHDMGSGGKINQAFEGFMFHHSGFVTASTGGRQIFSTLRAMCMRYGVRRSLPTWLATKTAERVAYVNLNNDAHEIAIVSSDGLEVAKNGKNDHQAILAGDAKMKPVVVTPNVDHHRLEARWDALIGQFLACSELSRNTIFSWTCLFPLIGFSGTRPMLRLEGQPASGKTWASKMLTTLVFGDDQQKKATTAANYVDAAMNPLVALDNVEMSNATTDFVDFLLTVVTGIHREKRKGNSDNKNVSERPTCLVMSTGVEPLGGDLAEIMSRSFVLTFVAAAQREAMIESDVLDRIKEARNELFSLILARCAVVLRLIDDYDGLNRAMLAISRAMGAHEKRRCDNFLALMYLIHVAAVPDTRVEDMLDNLTPTFAAQIASMNENSNEVARESSPTASVLGALFSSQHEERPKTYGLRWTSTSHIDKAKTRELFVALRTVSRDANLFFPYKNPKQFGRRLAMEIDNLNAEGFRIEVKTGAARVKYYSITEIREDETTLQPDTDEEVDFTEYTRDEIDDAIELF